MFVHVNHHTLQDDGSHQYSEPVFRVSFLDVDGEGKPVFHKTRCAWHPYVGYFRGPTNRAFPLYGNSWTSRISVYTTRVATFQCDADGTLRTHTNRLWPRFCYWTIPQWEYENVVHPAERWDMSKSDVLVRVIRNRHHFQGPRFDLVPMRDNLLERLACPRPEVNPNLDLDDFVAPVVPESFLDEPREGRPNVCFWNHEPCQGPVRVLAKLMPGPQPRTMIACERHQPYGDWRPLEEVETMIADREKKRMRLQREARSTILAMECGNKEEFAESVERIKKLMHQAQAPCRITVSFDQT